MKSQFIKVRYDRMKNEELLALYHLIMNHLESYDAKQLDLSMAFDRFCQQEETLQNLRRKQRKLPQTAQIVVLRKQNDKLVSALLLHLKALKQAEFDDQKLEIQISYDWTRKLFKNFVHEGRFTKNGKLNALLQMMKQDKAMRVAYEKLGLMRYIQQIEKVKSQITENTEKNKAEKRLRPAAGVTIPSKEHVTDELRLLLQTIEITAITHPETDYTSLIRIINLLLTEARAQLRNLATRRKTTAAKAEQKLLTDESEKVQS